MEIMKAGGGIAYSIAETSAASEDELYELAWRRLQYARTGHNYCGRKNRIR